MKTLTEEKAKILRDYANIIEKEQGCEKLYLHMDVVPYCELLDLNADTVTRLSKENNVYGDIAYTKVTEEGTVKYVTVCHTYVDNEQIVQWNEEFSNETDILGLFAKNGEMTLTEFFNQTSDKIADYVKENDPDLWQELREGIITDLEESDLTDGLKEDCGKSWVYENIDDAFDICIRESNDYELRERAKEIIDSL